MLSRYFFFKKTHLVDVAIGKLQLSRPSGHLSSRVKIICWSADPDLTATIVASSPFYVSFSLQGMFGYTNLEGIKSPLSQKWLGGDLKALQSPSGLG